MWYVNARGEGIHAESKIHTLWTLYEINLKMCSIRDFVQCLANVEDVGPTLYKCFVFAGQEDFPSNIVHFSNVASMLGQRRRRWPNTKTVLGEYLVGVVSI